MKKCASLHFVVICLATVLGASLAARAPAADSDKRMNVLFIISDDLRNEMGCYGSQMAETPHLDKLAASGVRFDRAYCQFPLCNPSRSSMLTGLRPTSNGVLGNRDWFGHGRPELLSLPHWFKNHGYDTLRAGKIFHGGIDDAEAWTVGGQERRFGPGATAPVPRRNQTSRGAVREAGRRLTKAERSDRWLVLDGDGEKHGDYRVAERTIAYLKEYAAKPDQLFFLGCGFSKPHSPLEAPQRFYDLFDLDSIELPPDFAERPTVPAGFPAGCIRPKNADLFIGRGATPQAAKEMNRAYLASTAWMDWNAGRVLDVLDALGLRETTIVVFWGDHGYQLGEKGKWSKAGSLWEQGARVPLLICDPRAKANGKPSPRVVETLDLYPTLLDLCGLPPNEAVEGRSLAPLLDDPEIEWDHPAFTVWSEDGKHVTGASVRTEHWRYSEFYGRGAGSLLTDPQSDPHEMTNVVTNPANSDDVAFLSRMVRWYTRGHRPPGSHLLSWQELSERPNLWDDSEQSIRIAENLLLYQHPNGGWAKNIDMARVLSEEQMQEIRATRDQFETMIDNRATYTQIQYLAKLFQLTGKKEYADAAQRGIEYLLAAQYDNGGWPMIYPLRPGYYSHITFNDGSMIGVMSLLRDIARADEPYGFVDANTRQRAATAVANGVEAILKCQIEVNGRLTAWCAQHDEQTFEPRRARTYELPSISGQESVGIVRFLMQQENPSPDVCAAIDGAIAWFKEAAIEGIRVKIVRDPELPRGYDKQVVHDESADPMWARFHAIGTNKPMFVNRDGKVHETIDKLLHERRVGYRWLTQEPAALLTKDYPVWKLKRQTSTSSEPDE